MKDVITDPVLVLSTTPPSFVGVLLIGSLWPRAILAVRVAHNQLGNTYY